MDARHKKEFRRRRQRLMDFMGEKDIAILLAGPARVRNRDVEYPFRPDSDFHYLTGFPEPEALAVFSPGRSKGEFLLFCRERNPKQEQWLGARAGLEGACRHFGADDAFPIDDVDDILPGLLENRKRVFYAIGSYPEFDQKILTWVNKLRAKSRQGTSAPTEFVAFEHLLHEMRLFKSSHEIELLRKAADISALAHRRAMGMCRPGIAEYQIEAELTYEFTRSGSRSPAYPSIVASGSNGCVLHYIDNRSVLKDGALLLIDAGAEYQYYASDITRTFPVNGRFSPAQRQIYELVLASQEAAIREARPGNHWNDMHDAVVRVLTEGLVNLGFLKGRVNTLIKNEKYKKFFMHRTGHWLGLDVHDVGDYKVDDEWRLLEPGMVLTVEPGLYIPGGNNKIPRKWWNIGVRIEDDILITKDGPEILSRNIPRSVDEIEALVGSMVNE
ncbi:MAG: aminopeptidase P Metallo peptidase. MEROPS family M24B [Candidatus Kentron sp. G]|nr:MAG: aminopeptidase P Metallo peptidase. MEROPS family M24B [Candidatus Kentron sp. G]VFN02363.1 MAG: aminopeptidase P Metallo peptidase. MEROPS family M24B [Candidatus Kentron sp. G]VFN04087.1 MAG: aminopeptidase P Metallo peptidase. MEROPS family M24B [Candidatus Kentron sp. G]